MSKTKTYPAKDFWRANGKRVSTAGKWYSSCGRFILWRHKKGFWRLQSDPIFNAAFHRQHSKKFRESGISGTNFPTRREANEVLQIFLANNPH